MDAEADDLPEGVRVGDDRARDVRARVRAERLADDAHGACERAEHLRLAAGPVVLALPADRIAFLVEGAALPTVDEVGAERIGTGARADLVQRPAGREVHPVAGRRDGVVEALAAGRVVRNVLDRGRVARIGLEGALDGGRGEEVRRTGRA